MKYGMIFSKRYILTVPQCLLQRHATALFLLFHFVVEVSSGSRWNNKLLPPGYELVDGEAIDVTDKVIQEAGSIGCQYFAFDDPKGDPLYIRDGYEKGWHFIVFDDPYNQDPGGGHLIVLQRMTGISTDSKSQIIYEAFLLSLEDSIAADAEPYDAQETDYYKDEDETNAKHDEQYIES